MSVILAPNGFGAARKLQETLSKEEINLVVQFERWCNRRGLQMDLLCRKCYDEGLNPRCVGDNDEDELKFKINCNHCDRIYNK